MGGKRYPTCSEPGNAAAGGVSGYCPCGSIPFASAARAIGLGSFVAMVFGRVMTGVRVLSLWTFLGLVLGGSKVLPPAPRRTVTESTRTTNRPRTTSPLNYESLTGIKSINLFIPNLAAAGQKRSSSQPGPGLQRRGNESLHCGGPGRKGRSSKTFPPGVEFVDLQATFPGVCVQTLALKHPCSELVPDYLLSTLDILGSAVLARNLAQVPTQVMMVVQTHLTQQFKDRHGPLDDRLKWFGVEQMYTRADAIAAALPGGSPTMSLVNANPRQG